MIEDHRQFIPDLACPEQGRMGEDDENGRKDDMQQEQGGAPLNTKEGTPLRMSLWFKEHNEESLRRPS